MIRLFAKGRVEGSGKRLGIVEELELLWRRSRLALFGVPVLVVFGLGVGQLLKGALSLREGEPARVLSAEERAAPDLADVSQDAERVRSAGFRTAAFVHTYQDEVAPVEQVLLNRGVNGSTARQVAWPLVEQSKENGVDPATVLSVMLIESAGKPDARSSVGARGLMQVMPAWAGYWRGCGRNLFAIEDNLCHGTRILALYLDQHRGDERQALLGYNGCVRGVNTPNCRAYPEKVASVRREVRSELARAKSRSHARADATQ